MLNQPTMERLQAMKLHGMAQAFREQYESAAASQLSCEERFGLLVDCQWTWKENRALTRRLQLAKFKERGLIEDIDYQHPRGLDRRLMRTLASSDWVRQHQNLLLIGPTGIGKTWLACALAHKACRDGFFAVHKRMAELFRDLAVARADGSIGSLLTKLARTDVLVLDDFARAPMKDSERRDFLEICDDRYQRRSTILTSQSDLWEPVRRCNILPSDVLHPDLPYETNWTLRSLLDSRELKTLGKCKRRVACVVARGHLYLRRKS